MFDYIKYKSYFLIDKKVAQIKQNSPSYLLKLKVLITLRLQELAPCTLMECPVAGHHRAYPSASLDKKQFFISVFLFLSVLICFVVYILRRILSIKLLIFKIQFFSYSQILIFQAFQSHALIFLIFYDYEIVHFKILVFQ